MNVVSCCSTELKGIHKSFYLKPNKKIDDYLTLTFLDGSEVGGFKTRKSQGLPMS